MKTEYVKYSGKDGYRTIIFYKRNDVYTTIENYYDGEMQSDLNLTLRVPENIDRVKKGGKLITDPKEIKRLNKKRLLLGL